MTERQILLLHDAEQRRQRRDRAARMLDMNLAFVANKNAAAHMKELSK
jgi:hypothetical protein